MVGKCHRCFSRCFFRNNGFLGGLNRCFNLLSLESISSDLIGNNRRSEVNRLVVRFNRLLEIFNRLLVIFNRLLVNNRLFVRFFSILFVVFFIRLGVILFSRLFVVFNSRLFVVFNSRLFVEFNSRLLLVERCVIDAVLECREFFDNVCLKFENGFLFLLNR